MTKCSVNNIVEIPRDVKWCNNKLKAHIHMKVTTYGIIIVTAAQFG